MKSAPSANDVFPETALVAENEDWQEALEPGERVVASFHPDLDVEHRFRRGTVVLTDRRLLSFDERGVHALARTEVTELSAHDRGGLGQMIALGTEGRLASWSYTVTCARQAAAFVAAYRGTDAERELAGAEPREEDEEIEAIEAVVHEPPPRIGTLFRLLRFARAHLGQMTLGILLTLLGTFAGLIPPYLTWPLVDEVFAPYQDQVRQTREDAALSAPAKEARLAAVREQGSAPFARVPWFLGAMLASALAAWVLGWAQGWVLARLSERISADLRNTTYAHLQRMSLDYFTAKRTGDLVSRISSDTDRICAFLSDTLMDFVTDVLMIVGATIMLFRMDPILALATLSTFPLVAWMTLVLRSRLTHGFSHGYRAWGLMTSLLADTIPGVRVVKAFAQEDREVERFRAANQRIVDANDKVNRLWTFFWPLVGLLNQLGLLVAWGLGAWRVYDQRITVGVLTAFLAYIARFYARLESMTRMAGNTQRAAASAQRIFDILDRAPSVPEPAQPVSPGQLVGDIELSGVSFRFGNRKILEDVNLHIRPGELVGLVGPTGAGKSTLVNLVCRFYDPSDGVIRVDGTDLRAFSTSEYRRHIGIVLQDPFLFYGTIASNIAYGRPEATREEIILAAKAARAHEFILQLPDGYDSIVGERGQTLSGGERQRVSIARALIIDPKILILDEATSAIDPHTERQIQEALENLVRGRTTIAIAHRLSTLRAANRLVVLERGRIVEIGSHDELLTHGGVYRRLHDAQLRHEEMERRAPGVLAEMPA